jgi:hypothetical protein
MKFNRELAIKVALVVAILIVMSVSAHLYSKRKKEHFEGDIDIDALRGFSKGEPGSNWEDQDLWSKGTHQVNKVSNGTDFQFKNNIVNMILAKAATEASRGRGNDEKEFNKKIETVQSDMNAISNQVGTNKSAQVVINAKRQTYDDKEPSRISSAIVNDNQEDEKKIATAVAKQASEQTGIDNTQDITISAMAAQNTKQDDHITKLDLPVGTIMSYSPKKIPGSVTSDGSPRNKLYKKGWAICDSVSNKDTKNYNNEIIPDLTDRFLKGHNFTTTAPLKRTGKSWSNPMMNIADGLIRMTPKQMPPHSHSFTAVLTVKGGGQSSNDMVVSKPPSTGNTGPTGSGAQIDIRPPFYMVVYIMKFKSVS